MNSLKKVFVFALFFISALVFAGCGAKVTIEITMNSKMMVGESYDLSAKVEGIELSQVEWSIDDTTKATIENGKILAKAEGSFILTAQYDKVKKYMAITVEKTAVYSISYSLNGGKLDGTEVKEFTDPSLVVLPTPTRPGYEFVGWTENGNEITKIKEAKHYTLKANWEVADIEMTYELYGGKVAGKPLPKTRTIEDVIELSRVSKNGYTFEGWYDNPNFTGEAITELNDTNIEITHLYAKLVAETYGISFELNEGTCEGLPKERSYEDVITLPIPTKQGYVFVGWFEKEDFSGDKVTQLDKTNTEIEKLYAKYEVITFKVKYVLNNPNAQVSENEVATEFFNTYTLVTPTFNDKWYAFKGWFADEELTEQVTEVKEKEGTVVVYGKWEDLMTILTYETNSGSFQYGSRAEMVADFINDYNTLMEKTYKLDGSDIPTGAWDESGLYKFFDKENAQKVKMCDKWQWLAQYLYNVSKEQLASNNCNVLGLNILLTTKDYSSYNDAIYGITYAFRAFLAQKTVRPNSGYTSVDFSNYDNANNFWATLAKYEDHIVVAEKGKEIETKEPKRENYSFGGWYNNPEFNGDPVTKVTSTCTLYAKWNEPNPVTKVTINGSISEMERFTSHQITWTIEPADATIQAVKLTSSNTSVATIDDKGLITAVGEGKTTITVMSNSTSHAAATFELEVYAPDHFEVSYETNSYVEMGKTIKLNAKLVKRDKTVTDIEWASADTNVATVKDGVVTGVKAGVVEIYAQDKTNKDVKFKFVVTVLDNNLSDVVKFIVNANESNAFTRYNLGIGAGKPAYYRDIIGSVSKVLFQDYVVDRTFEAAQAAISTNHGGTKESTEFITVHYTGNMSPKATARANADYFSNGGGGTSIHYVTGNDGIFSSLDDKLVGYHAGDSTDVRFTWTATGVKYKDTDPTYPVWGITSNSKFSINGQETSIEVPQGKKNHPTYKVTGNTFMYNGTVQNCINDMGLPFKVVDGEYYMGTTWWCYSQVAAGRICSKGGNNNSIGIESAVNPESDLWLTWQLTAQLVAHLMIDNKLDITRVVGHHFYSAKDCPQPLLENDLEIWWEFIELVKAEYEVFTTFKDYTFSAEIVGTDEYASNNGRILETTESRVVTYKVTITNTKTNTTETIVLSSLVNSVFAVKDSAYLGNLSTYKK